MLARLPLLIQVEANGFGALPAELLLQPLGAIHLERDAALSRIEIELALYRELQRQPVTARVRRAEQVGNRRWFVVGKREPAFLSILGTVTVGRIGGMEPAAGDRLFGDHSCHGRHRLRHNGFGRGHVFLQEDG